MEPEEAQGWRERGSACIDAERYEEALAIYTAVLEGDPGRDDACEAWILQGIVLARMKRYEEVITACEHALALDLHSIAAWNNRGGALGFLKRHDEALTAFDHAIELDPANAACWVGRGSSLNGLGRYEEAVEAYQRAVDLNPNNKRAFAALGSVLTSLGRWEEALNEFDQALALDPNQLWSNERRAASLFVLKRYMESVTAYERLLSLTPDDASAWYWKGESLRHMSRQAEALASYDRAMALGMDDHRIHWGRGCVLASLQRNEEALAEADAALAHDPKDFGAWQLKSAMLNRLCRPSETLDACEQGLAIKPNDAEMLYRRIVALGSLGLTAEALVQCEEAPANLCDDWRFWQAKGIMLSRMQRHEESLAAREEGLRIAPNAVALLLGKANELLDLKRHEEALAGYERALELQPGDASVLQAMGITLERLERYEEALATFDKALELAPDDERIRASHDELLPWMRRTVPDHRLRLSDGRWLGYLDFGDPDGAPVFYFHGLPGSRLDVALYEPLLTELHIRLIAPERPGFGFSTYQPHRKILDWPDDVVALADHLAIARFAVLGLSGGGAYAAACAYKIPDRLLACGLVSSAAPPEAFSGKFEWTPAYISHRVARYSPHSLLRLLAAMSAYRTRVNPDGIAEGYNWRNDGATWSQLKQRAQASLTHTLTPTARESITEPFRQGGRGYARDNWLLTHSWGFPLQGITMPVHVWHGEADVMVPIILARYLASHIPNCQATYYPNGRHYLFDSHSHDILVALLAASSEGDNKREA